MELTRRDFLKATAAVAGALGLRGAGLLPLQRALALEAEDGGVPVVWLQGQSCTGCSVSLLNSIHFTSIDDLLLNSLDVDFHPSLMAGAGDLAVSAAEETYEKGGYVLVVEGAIPSGEDGKYCYLWPGTTAVEGIERYAEKAGFIIAVGTCASYGGLAAGAPNPTGARGLADAYAGKQVIKIPGCPAHPDWIVGTIAYLMANSQAPRLDADGRPTEFFSKKVHSRCPNQGKKKAENLSEIGCLMHLGCKGQLTKADCPVRRWNAAGVDEFGVNWCIGAGSPCYGCTDPGFPDNMSPFYDLEKAAKDGS